jgi:hypothetical protein
MDKWPRALSEALRSARYSVPPLRNPATTPLSQFTLCRRRPAIGRVGDLFGTIIAASGFDPEFKYVTSLLPSG